ncbi:MAG: hypothetical protein CJBNEKGG_02719 [Prosthecobacter sp.]|nr:hypothetical protein [Prosthecobacter sp.]
MPLAQIKGISGLLSQPQKEELIHKITDAIVSVEGEGLRPVTWVLLEEVPSGAWGVGGKALTTDDVRALAAPAACSTSCKG